MSLDQKKSHLTKIGRVVVDADGQITAEGFIGANCTCRDVAVLAAAHAIAALTREMTAAIEEPGGGRIGIG